MTSWPRLETIQQQLKTFTNKHLARWEPFEAMSSTNRGSTGQAMAEVETFWTFPKTTISIISKLAIQYL